MFFLIHLWPERDIELFYTTFVLEYEMQKYCFLFWTLFSFFFFCESVAKAFMVSFWSGSTHSLDIKVIGMNYEGTFKLFTDQSSAHWSSALGEKIQFQDC